MTDMPVGTYQGTLRKRLALTSEGPHASEPGAERSFTLDARSLGEGRWRAFALLKRDSPVENAMCWEVKHEMFTVSVAPPPTLEPAHLRPVS